MICGIDPGISGALALLDLDGRPVALVDMPACKVRIGATVRPRVDVPGVRDLLVRWQPAFMVLEEIEPRKGDGPRAGVLMKAAGQVEGVVIALRIPLVWASPQVWRRESGVSGKTYDDRKAASLKAARELFPTMGDRLTAADHVDRGEALLLARWGLRARALGRAA